MPAIKKCWFYEWAKLSYFTLKNGQETKTEFIALWRQFVCSGLFTPCYWSEIQRLRKCQVILDRIVSPIFGVVLMKVLWRTMRMLLKKALTHKLTLRVVSRDVLAARFKCHFWGKRSSTLRGRNNWNCVFQTLYFHIMWKTFSLYRHFNTCLTLKFNFTPMFRSQRRGKRLVIQLLFVTW